MKSSGSSAGAPAGRAAQKGATVNSTLEPVVLVLADISGYTRFVTANAKTLAHSQTIIIELIHALLEQTELPLEVAKLEGDAIFLYVRKQNPAYPWPEVRLWMGKKLLTFFGIFNEKLKELSQSSLCHCSACTHVERLRIKLVVHSGVALFHQVQSFSELSGADVILVHRLLKNSVNADQYLLLTEAARSDLEFEERVQFKPGRELYENYGQLVTCIHFPFGEESPARKMPSPAKLNFFKSWRWYLKLYFSPLFSRPVESSEVRTVSRVAFVLLVLLLSPFFLLASPFFLLTYWLRHSSRA